MNSLPSPLVLPADLIFLFLRRETVQDVERFSNLLRRLPFFYSGYDLAINIEESEESLDVEAVGCLE